MMMINVKSDQHCLICTIFSKQKKNLQKFHEIYTHKSTRKQFKKQVEDSCNGRLGDPCALIEFPEIHKW